MKISKHLPILFGVLAFTLAGCLLMEPEPCTDPDSDVIITQVSSSELILTNGVASTGLVTFSLQGCNERLVAMPRFRLTFVAVDGPLEPGGELLIPSVSSEGLSLDLMSVSITDTEATMLFASSSATLWSNWAHSLRIDGSTTASGSGRVDIILEPESPFTYADDGTTVPLDRIRGESILVTHVTVGTPP
jgi:hypothetical protein